MHVAARGVQQQGFDVLLCVRTLFFLCLGLCVCACVCLSGYFFPLFSRSIMIINKKECSQSVKTWTNENHNNITIRKSIIVSYLGSERSEFNALELSCLL